MERSAPYALIAAFVLAGLAVGAGLLIWLTDYDPGRRVATYGVVFDDVSGLSLASEVRYNGLPVGEVATMALDPAGTGLIRVEIEVLEEVPLRGGAIARLSTQGVTGVAVVALEGGDPQAPPLEAGPQGVPMLRAGRGAVETLADEAPALLEEVRVLVADLRAFVTPGNAARVSGLLTELERGATGLGEVGALTADLAGVGRDLAPTLRGVPDMIAAVEDAATATATLATTLRRNVADRSPAVLAATEDTLAGIRAATDAARARLDDAAPALLAATDAATSLRALTEGTRPLAARADAVLADVGVAGAALRDDLPPLLDAARRAAQTARTIGDDRLPGLVDRAEATLDAGEAAARAAEAQITRTGEALAAPLAESGPAISAIADAARAVEGVTAEVDGLASEIAPATRDLAAAGQRLAGSAEEVAAQIDTLFEDLTLLVADARRAVGATGSTLDRADGVIADFGRAAPGLDRTLRETAQAAEAVRRLAQRLARDPSILIRGR